jgi:hypothetical protein
MGLLRRYDAGEREAVWAEVAAAGPDTPDAEAVARRLMERVRFNVERLHDALLDEGYVFARPDRTLVPPADDVEDAIARVEDDIGPLPLALRAWALEVGSVDFVGSHPEWDVEEADPFCVDMAHGLADVVQLHRDWTEMGWYERWGLTTVRLDLSPDRLHKADVSGGSPYGVELPDPSVDPVWQNDELHPDATFVGYLRSALLRSGGFPAWSGPPEAQRALAARLRPF